MEKYVILKEQDLDDINLEIALKEISKKYRERVYKNGEFRNNIEMHGFYIFDNLWLWIWIWIKVRFKK